MSEPGSVPDGETLQNIDVARLKRRSWDTDIIGGYPRKRYDGDVRCLRPGVSHNLEHIRERRLTEEDSLTVVMFTVYLCLFV